MGKHRPITKEIIDRIIDLSLTMKQEDIAKYLQLSSSTIYKYCPRYMVNKVKIKVNIKNDKFIAALKLYEKLPSNIKDKDNRRLENTGVGASYISCPQGW